MDISLYCGLHKPLSFNIIKFICSFRKYFFYVFNPWNIEIYNILQIVSVIEECLFTTFGNFVNWIRNFICNLMSKDVGDIYREGYYRLHQTIRMSFRTKFNNGGKYLFIEHSSLCILYDHICSYVVLTINHKHFSSTLKSYDSMRRQLIVTNRLANNISNRTIANLTTTLQHNSSTSKSLFEK